MTRYLILDGYNLIGALKRYSPRSTGGLDQPRELIINDALKAAGWTAGDHSRLRRVAEPEPGRTEPGPAARCAWSTVPPASRPTTS